MKKMTLVLFFIFSISAMAAGEQGATCSKTTEVCAVYQSEAAFSTKQEGRFSLSLESRDLVEASLVKVDLWMQMGTHGHGSSPLKVTPVSPASFDVTKAFFMMKGAWQIRVTYKQGDVQETLIIPVQINE